jgi:hypothetical protein
VHFFQCTLVLGTPQKAESLPGLHCSTIYDPHPQRDSRVDKNLKLQALMVNYVYETKHDVNLRYIFPKANLQVAVQDHDYLERPFTEFWVIERNKVGYFLENH